MYEINVSELPKDLLEAAIPIIAKEGPIIYAYNDSGLYIVIETENGINPWKWSNAKLVAMKN